MSSKLKAPPLFNPDEDNYERFKKDLEIWNCFSDLDKKKKGPAVYLSLHKKAREAVRDLKVEEINTDDGMDKIIEKLDAVYLAETNTRAYSAFQKFYECKRTVGERFETFIVRFEQLYNDLAEFDFILPEGIRAFFVLNAFNLPDETERLARATCPELKYAAMKEQIKKICGSSGGSTEDSAAPPMKDEVLYNNFNKKKNWAKKRGHGKGTESRERKRTDEVAGASRYRGRASGRNPVNLHGIRMRCYICDSEHHFANECPQKSPVAERREIERINIVLLNAVPDTKQRSLMLEALGHGVLDCGCSRTVAGEIWMNEFLATLSSDDKDSVIQEESNAAFRFGDGGQCHSTKRLIVPVKIGRLRYTITIEVVQAGIPLLISKAAMKAIGMELNFMNDIATIDGEQIKLSCTSSGHYCLSLTTISSDDCNIVLQLSDGLTRKEKMSKALKLHRQFSHASVKKLLKLVQNSHIKDKEFKKCVKEVCENCEICRKYKPPPLKPAVSLPIATRFNEVVCLDLKEFKHNKVWILHMIDASTRYSAAVLINTKAKEEIIRNIFHIWIAYFGKPTKLMSDNGGEFSNEVYSEAAEKLGIEIVMPPADSPFSNGIVERHNKVVYETMMKTLEDTHCEPGVALAWACSAKNALQNNDGFSPNQLVFGHNINVPSVLTDDIPALETTTSSDIIRTNLQALHSARTNYIKAENSARIRRALKHKTRTYSEEQFKKGDKVFFKRRGVKGWKGPGRVIGADEYTILVKQGGYVSKCHRCHVMKVQPKSNVGTSNSGIHVQRQKRTTVKNSVIVEEDDSSDSSDDETAVADLPDEEDSSTEESDSDADDDENHHSEADSAAENNDLEDEDHNDDENNDREIDPEDNHDDSDEQESNSEEVSSLDDYESTPEELNDHERDWLEPDFDEPKNNFDASEVDAAAHIETNFFGPDTRPKVKSYIAVKLLDSDWKQATILSHQPKKTGKHKDWVNVQVQGESEPSSLNWQNVEQWKVLPNPETPILLTAAEELSQEVVDAKFGELSNLKENEVFEEVAYNGQPTVSSRWVITEKNIDGNRKVKARLVARGFEEDSEELGLRTDSPTCSKHALRTVMISASTFHWAINSIDVASAFLQGNEIGRELYLRPPEDICPADKVWKLKRCLYGLNDAPRAWYDKVTDEFENRQGIRSKLDNAMFMWYDNSVLVGHLVSHVDDFTYAGTNDWQKTVIESIKMQFNISAESHGSFKYLGLNVAQTESEISIDQKHYIRKIQEIPIAAERKTLIEDDLTKEEKSQLKSLSGQMLWVTSQTRPDMSFETCMMSNMGKKPTVKKLIDANKAVRKISNSNDVRVRFRSFGKIEDIEVVVYGDATHASLPDGASQGAYIVFVVGSDRKVVPMLWQSKKLKRVTKSPLASETHALGEAADAGLLVANMIQEIYLLPNIPKVVCFTDSKSLRDLLHTTNTVDDMSLRVAVARLREMINMREISVNWVEGKRQLADVMTKRGASSDVLLRVLEHGEV